MKFRFVNSLLLFCILVIRVTKCHAGSKIAGPLIDVAGVLNPSQSTHATSCVANEEFKYGNQCHEFCEKPAYFCSQQKYTQGCFCKEGYKRINGVCVEDCKCLCNANEEYTYGHDCFEKCINTEHCKHYVLYKRCFCLPNYKRVNGVCIPESNCPCPENEQYWVGNECMDTEGTDVMDCVNSPLHHGCYCQRGHRRINGKCIPYSDIQCDQNELFTISNTCMEQCFANPIECAQEYAYGLCLCFPGYVRINGFCVPDTNCPCGQNEEYTFSSECIERCGEDEETCKNEYQYKRCTCRDGFKRINGNCVSASQCGCPPNEYMSNTNDCFETCGSNYLDCALLPIVRRCTCNFGYTRINGVCVQNTECGSTCTKNEVYGRTSTCFEDCYRNPMDCLNEFAYDRCGCAENYKRINGTCVPDKYCHCGPHEEYRYGNECYDYCHNDYDKCAKYGTYKSCFCSEGCKRFNGVCKPRTCPKVHL